MINAVHDGRQDIALGHDSVRVETMRIFNFQAEVEDVIQCVPLVSAYAREQGLSFERAKEIEVAVEEALVNICRHAYANGDGDIELRLNMNDHECFVITVIDRGIPFNPLSIDDPKLAPDIATQPLGGLGILLMRRLMDDVIYHREDDQNILELVVYAP